MTDECADSSEHQCPQPMTQSFVVTGLDSEVDAMTVCIRAVQHLDEAGRRRVLAYVSARYEGESYPIMGVPL